jgi:LuxR family maltose regulon positive regulatory protein
MEADLASSFLMGLTDRPENAAEWLRRGDVSEKRLFSMSIPYAQILLGKYLIQSGRPEIWLGMESDALGLASLLRFRMAEIYGGILTAAAWRAQGKTGRAAAALTNALGLALPDRLYMPFVENLPLLGPMLAEHCPGTAFEAIAALADKQEVGKAAILRGLCKPLPFVLTQREYDVAELAARRLKNKEIAEKLFISENTVKLYLRNVFQKLDIQSRTELAAVLNPN